MTNDTCKRSEDVGMIWTTRKGFSKTQKKHKQARRINIQIGCLSFWRKKFNIAYTYSCGRFKLYGIKDQKEK